LLVNDGLSGGQVKGLPLAFGVQAPVHKEVVAIGLQESLDLIGALWLLPQVSDLLIEGLGGALGRSRLGCDRVTQPQRALGLEALRTADGSD
jgi:hypothetical protein